MHEYTERVASFDGMAKWRNGWIGNGIQYIALSERREEQKKKRRRMKWNSRHGFTWENWLTARLPSIDMSRFRWDVWCANSCESDFVQVQISHLANPEPTERCKYYYYRCVSIYYFQIWLSTERTKRIGSTRINHWNVAEKRMQPDRTRSSHNTWPHLRSTWLLGCRTRKTTPPAVYVIIFISCRWSWYFWHWKRDPRGRIFSMLPVRVLPQTVFAAWWNSCRGRFFGPPFSLSARN